MTYFTAHAFGLAIEHMAQRRHRTFAGEVEMRDVVQEAKWVSRELSRLVLANEYRFTPAQAHVALTDGKARQLFRSSALDSIVERVLARFLADALEAQLSPCLYSYRSGRSMRHALHAFSDHVREHRRLNPSPLERGLYVLRRDVKSYGESIRVDSESPLWRLLNTFLKQADARDAKIAMQLLQQLLPREYTDEDGRAQKLLVGTPTGSGIQPVLNNVYLSDLDRELDGLGFYLRFGDDLLFSTTDLERVREVSARIDARLSALSLVSKQEKAEDLDFNGAARIRAPGFRATDTVDYLGMRISFRGAIGLRSDKWRLLVRGAYKRMERSLAGVSTQAIEDRARAIGRVARDSLNPAEALALHHAADLLDLVDDRSQLREFDYLLSLRTAELVTHRRGPRAFRSIEPQELRRLGLPSEVRARNHKTKQRATS